MYMRWFTENLTFPFTNKKHNIELYKKTNKEITFVEFFYVDL